MRDPLMTVTESTLRASGTETPLPFVSVLVPVRNEAGFLRATLEQLLRQDYPSGRFEVLVADGGSTDSTCDIVRELQREYPNLRLLHNPKRWSSAGRNVAVRAARGRLLVLVDGHCQIRDEDYLRAIVSAFERSGADCIGRPQPLDVRGASSLQQAIAAARASRLGHHPDSHIYAEQEGFVPPQSVAIAYRREVFEKVGLFDERFDACEDVEFNTRVAAAGLRCFFTPKVAVHYHPRATLPGLFRQMTRYGRGRVRLLRKHPTTFSLKSLLPALFLLGVLAGPLVCWWAPLRLAYLGTLAIYLTVVLAFSLALSVSQRRLDWLAKLPFIFPTIHLGAGFGLLREWLAGAETQPIQTVEPVSIPASPRPVTPLISQPVLNALSFDVEDYFHVSGFEQVIRREDWPSHDCRVEANTDRILARLDEAGAKATFFVLGWVAERYPRLVQRIHAAGHEIGSHGYWHRLIYAQTADEFRADLCQSRDLLQDLTGQKVQSFRAPSFSITQKSLWALDVLLEEGFLFDSSIYPTHHDRYGIPGTSLEPHAIRRPAGTLWEFPAAVWPLLGYPLPIGGGGYLRLYPYALTRRGLHGINATGRPFVVYLHPWEFDPAQPRIRAGRLRSFRHYVGLARTEGRLVRLLRDFRFGTLTQSLASFRPESVAAAPRVSVPRLAG